MRNVYVDAESSFGTAAGAAYSVEVREFAEPNMPSESISRAEATRYSSYQPPPFAGREGGDGPELTIHLPIVAADRADGATDYAPDALWPILLRAALGDAALTTGSDGTYQGQVTGGDTIATIDGTDPTASLTVDNDAERFAVGAIAVAESATNVLYPLMITGITALSETLTIHHGPADKVLADGDRVLGTWTLPLQVTASGSQTVSVEAQDRNADFWLWQGCAFTPALAVEAGQPTVLTLTGVHDRHSYSGSQQLTPAGSPNYPGRTVLLGANGVCRLAATAAAMGTALAVASLEIDWGLERPEQPDVNGAHGRAGYPVVGLTPVITATVYYDDDTWLGYWEDGTELQFTAHFGTGTTGGWGVTLTRARMLGAPEVGDTDGIRTATVQLIPVDDVDDAAPTVPGGTLFFF